MELQSVELLPLKNPDFPGRSVLVNLALEMNLKGVFAKNERGYRLNAIKKRF